MADEFAKPVSDLWNLVSQINSKPTHKDLTWTYGVIKGKGQNWLDLQVYALSLACSIIVTEDVVPRIICCWDSPQPYINQRYRNKRLDVYPTYLMENLGVTQDEMLEQYPKRINKIDTSYFSLYRATRSVNPWPMGFGIGYRTKYLGMDFVKTPYAVMTDADTVCLEQCTPYLMSEVEKNPSGFMWTCFWEPHNKKANVGMNVYNMKKYRNVYQPYFNSTYWDLPSQDALFVGNVLDKNPEITKKLKVYPLDFDKVATGKYRKYTMAGNKTTFNENTSLHWHAWKQEYTTNPQGFIDSYRNIFENLTEKCHTILNR